MNPEDSELEDISNRILANQEEAKRLQDQLVSEKLMTFYKENMTFKTKKVSYEGFIKEVYK
jgi:trigger factor